MLDLPVVYSSKLPSVCLELTSLLKELASLESCFIGSLN
ncbi:hypothetical protein THIOSC13_1710011 [uncultured Thiomicrorhabdus sp.]